MPKILVFTQNLDFYSDQLLSGLVEHGYQILVVLSPQPQATAPKWDPRLTIIAEVELRGRLDSQAAAQYADLIIKHQPDLCLCYTSRALSIALKARRSHKLKVPVLGTRGAVGGLSCWYVQDWFSYLNPSLDGVVCFSDAIRLRLQSEARRLWPSHPGKFITIYQGYSPLLATAKKRNHQERAEASVKIISTIANERPIKGMNLLLDALEFHMKSENWKLLWIGKVGDKTKKRIEQSARLKDHVICTGFRQDARELIAQSDIYVQPTLAPGEGIGNAIAEAMASELPVVTSNVGGALELVKPVSPELLFEAGNAKSLSDALEKLLGDSLLCEKLGRAGVEVLRSRFGLDEEIEQYLKLFKSYGL
jgi:glycosyltransferase involved in cell wall biosynthesis